MIQRLCTLAIVALVVVAGRNCHAVLINSWENDVEGWTILQSPAYASVGFSTTTGVTNQTYSWEIAGSPNPTYGTFFESPSTNALTTLLSSTDKLSIDVTVPEGGDFGWFLQWSMYINNADTGFQSLDGYSYSQSANIGSSTPKTLTWTLPAGYRNTLASSPNPTSVGFLIGGGNNSNPNTMFVDNLRTTPFVPEPATGALLGMGAAAWAAVRRRR